MKTIGKLFLQGFMAILPVVLTLYILSWLVLSAESMLGSLIKLFVPANSYVPGMGVAAGFFIIVGVGILLRVWLFRKIFQWSELILEKLPFIKSLYGSIRDLMSFFDISKKEDFNKVVLVSLGDENIRLMGLVTREDFSQFSIGIDHGEAVAVYLPMSYQMGGFTVFVPNTYIRPIDMSIDEAIRFILTAGVSTQKRQTSEIQ
jgi:uncharacterized membrane protein